MPKVGLSRTDSECVPQNFHLKSGLGKRNEDAALRKAGTLGFVSFSNLIIDYGPSALSRLQQLAFWSFRGYQALETVFH